MAAPITDDELNSLFGDAPATELEINGLFEDGPIGQGTTAVLETETPKQLSGRFSNSFTAPFELIAAKWNLGQASVTRSAKGWDILQRQLSEEEEAAAIADLNPEHLKELGQDVDLYQEKLGPWHFYQFVGDAAEFGPSLVEGAKGAAGGAAAGAVAGAGVGAASGNLTGVGIALPEELLTVPGGALWGARLGAKTGAFFTAARLSAGEVYVSLRENGISQGTARNASLAAGGVMGAIEFFQLKGLSSVGKKAFLEQLKTEGGKAALQQYVKNYAKEVGEQVIQEDLQELTAITAEVLTAVVENNPNAMPSMDEIILRMVDTTLATARGSVVLVGGAQGAGAGAGQLQKRFGSVFSNPTSEAQRIDSIVSGKLAERGAESLATGQTSLIEFMDALREGLSDPGALLTDVDKQKAALIDDEKALDILFNGEQRQQQEQALADETGVVLGSDANPIQAGVEFTEGIPEQADNLDQQIERLKTEIGEMELEGVDVSQAQGQLNRLEQVRESLAKPVVPDAAEFKARQKRINSEIRTIDNQLAKLEKQLAVAEEKGNATKAIQNRIGKLSDLRDTLDTERALIQEGLLTSDAIGTGKTDLSVGRIANIRAKATDRILAAFDKGMREGVRLTKGNIKEIQNQVTGLIRKSGLDPKNKAKFLSTVKNIQTPDQLTKQLPELRRRISELAEQEFTKTAQQRINRLLKRTKLKKGGKKPKGKFTADTQKILNAYKELLDSKDVRRAAYESSLVKLQSGTLLTPDEAVRFELASKLANFENMTGEQLDNLANEIETVMTTGRSEAAERAAQRKQERSERRKIAIESVIGSKPPQDGVPNRFEKAVQKLNSFLGGFDSWTGLTKVMSEHDKNEVLVDLLDVHEAKRNEAEATYTILNGVTDRLMEAYGIAVAEEATGELTQKAGLVSDMQEFVNDLKQSHSRQLVSKLVDDSKPSIMLEFQNQDGQFQKLQMTRMQARKLFMEMQDLSLREALQQGNKYTFGELTDSAFKSTEQALRDILTDEDIALIDFQREFYQTYYQRTNEFYRNKYGVDLPFNENYSPIRRSGVDKSVMQTILDEAVARASIVPGSTISRTDNLYSLELQDDIKVMQRHIMEWEHFINWDEALVRIDDVLSSAEFRDVVKKKYSPRFYGLVQRHYEDFVRDRQIISNAAFDFFDTFSINLVKAKLGLKTVGQALKQMTSVFTFLDYVPASAFASGLADFAKNPVAASKVLQESPIIKTRWRNISRDIRDAMNTEEFAAFRKHRDLTNLLMIGVTAGDAATVFMGGWAVYKHELAKTGDHEKAIRKFERAVEETQQSGSIDQQSAWQRDNSFVRMFTRFMSSPNQFMRKEMHAVRKFANSDMKPADITEMLRTLAIYHVLTPLTFQFVATGFSFDEDDWDKYMRAAVLGNINGFFILGEMVEYIGGVALNLAMGKKSDEGVFEPNPAIIDEWVNDPIKLMKAIGDVAKTEDNIDIYADMMQDSKEAELVERIAETADVFGFPTETAFDMVDSLTKAVNAGDPWAAALTIAGWPKSVIKKMLEPEDDLDVLDIDDSAEQSGSILDFAIRPIVDIIRGQQQDESDDLSTEEIEAIEQQIETQTNAEFEDDGIIEDDASFEAEAEAILQEALRESGAR